jgi:hypothetical protein
MLRRRRMKKKKVSNSIACNSKGSGEKMRLVVVKCGRACTCLE